MNFEKYLQPKTIEEALKLAQLPGNIILGGMLWTRMQRRNFKAAIDLSLLGLDKIEEREDGIYIGAYVTLRQAETDQLLNEYSQGAVAKALAPIIGVQFRNAATMGGSVFGRFSFSDITTLLCALDAQVVLAKKGIMPIGDFVSEGAPKDVLTHIILPKNRPDKVVYMAHRNESADFPVITLGLCKRGDKYMTAVAPAPIRAICHSFVGNISSEQDRKEIIERFMEKLTFSSGSNASKEYKAHLAKVLATRAFAQIGE